MYHRIITVALTSTLVPGLPARADAIIDLFQDPQAPYSAGNTSSVDVLTQSFPHVLGGRGLILSPNTTADIGAGNNSLTLDFQGTGIFSLGYGGSSGLMPWAPAPMNLFVDSAADYLELTFSSYTHPTGQDMTLETWFQTELGQETTSQPVTMTFTGTGPQVVDIPLDGLADPTLDFLTFEFHASTGTQFQLQSVVVIMPAPEPGALALWASSLALLLSRRRRRR